MGDTVIEPTRRLPLSGCFNFRDLGGYRAAGGRRLRWRTLFRADGLTRLDPADCRVLGELGLATVIDLRTRGEADERGRFPLELLAVSYHHLPLIDVLPATEELEHYREPAFVTARYREILREGSASINRAVEILAEPGSLPAVFHCSAGKDRTGVLAALVLGFLGVPTETIVEDYALSSQAMVAMLEWMRKENPDSAERIERLRPAVMSAPSESMAAFVEALLDEHGSFEKMAARLELIDAVVRLRHELLEADPFA
ncbi:MAG TPA: tyrosine-protein phosphatase [Acidimicrobiales bacterium]|nr:tyrosine-protein phosphatase [Acidimicrobiales bacterium]